jgi:hypothetical protein
MPLIEDALSSLSDLETALEASDRVGCHVFLYSAQGTLRDRWQRVSMEASLAQRFVDALAQTVADVRQGAVEENGLLEFDFDAMASGSIGVMSLDTAPHLGDWLNQVPPEDWPTVFTADPSFVQRTRFFSVRYNLPDGRLLKTFRGKRGVQIILERGNRLAAMFRQDSNEMQPVDSTVITFDQQIDFFEWDGFVFIVNLGAFESITNIREITATKAHEAIDAISARFGLADAQGLKNHLSGRAKLAKKLAAAVQHGLLQDVDGARLLARIQERGFDVRMQERDGTHHFDIDLNNRSEVEQFVNLMTDVYLHSPVTNREWKAISKTPA